MHSVVSLLDAASEQKVKAIWQDLEQVHKLKGVKMSSIPHFTWQLAEAYKQEGAREVLDELADDILPFTVRTSGLGLFTGEQPTLYLPLVKDRMLLEIHALLWQSFEDIAKLPHSHSHPDVWTPHIGLACGDLGKDIISDLVETMALLPLGWDITVDSLALLCQEEGEQTRLEYQVSSKPLAAL